MSEPRSPDQNNPLAPILPRAERQTRRTYADPTGGRASGAVTKEDKDGLIAQARAARRAELEQAQCRN